MKAFLTVLFLIVSILLTVIVIIQPSKGEGLGSIGGGGQMFFSKHKGIESLLEKTTTVLGILFALLAIIVGR